MKARNLLKILFTMTAVFAFTATFAQENAPWQDMDGTSADAETDSVVVGMTIPYYVEPDPVLNSLPDLYDPSQSNGDQGIESTFSWEETTGNGTVIIDPPSGDNDAPYREIIFEDAASYTIGVTESNAAGCDGDQETQEVLAIEEPSYTINTTSYEICDGETQSILVDITANLGGWSSFYFMMDIEKTIDDGATDIYTHNDTIASVGASEGSDIDLFEDKLFTAAEDGGEKQVTEYTFTVSGMNHHISRKGDFLNLPDDGDVKEILDIGTYDEGTEQYNIDQTLYTWFGGGETITVTVYPSPNTGDIHYVPNDFEL